MNKFLEALQAKKMGQIGKVVKKEEVAAPAPEPKPKRIRKKKADVQH